jgi:4-amino-4-deoxy-L-arabinose transferase-like glycosyltransferase
MLAAVRRVPTALALVLAVAAIQSVAWDVAVPAFQGPDESGHFAYLQHLAETGETPTVATGAKSNSTEAQTALEKLNLQALIGDLSARPAWTTLDLERWRSVERALPASASTDGSGPNALAKNPPLYYAAMAIPYRAFAWLPLLQRIFVLRLFNALLYLATVTTVWLIAGELFGQVRWKQTLAAGVVALQPQLAFMSAVVNADNLLVVLTTVFLLSALMLVTRGPSVRRVLISSLLAAAAALTHGRGLITLPVLVTALAVAWVRHRPALSQVLRELASAVGVLAVVALLYLSFGTSSGSGVAYGGQVSLLNGGTFNLGQFLSSIYQFYLPRLPSLQPRLGPSYGYRQVFIETFYGTFGSLEVRFPTRLYDVLEVLSAIGLLAFYTACVVRRRRLMAAWPVVVTMLSLLVGTIGFLHYASYRALLGGGADPLIVGRYLLPIVSLFALAITFTAGAMPRRLGPFLAAAILGAGVLLSLTGIGLAVARFYA